MDVQLLIGFKEIPAHGGRTFDRINPVTGERATRASAASVEDARMAAAAAAAAFPAWAGIGPSARRFLTKPPMQYRRSSLHSHLP